MLDCIFTNLDHDCSTTASLAVWSDVNQSWQPACKGVPEKLTPGTQTVRLSITK